MRKEFKTEKYKNHLIKVAIFETKDRKGTKAEVIDTIAKEDVNMKLWDEHISKTKAVAWAKKYIDTRANSKVIVGKKKVTKKFSITDFRAALAGMTRCRIKEEDRIDNKKIFYLDGKYYNSQMWINDDKINDIKKKLKAKFPDNRITSNSLTPYPNGNISDWSITVYV